MTINRTVTTQIDQEKCIGCGECVKVCPKDTISLVGETAKITGLESLVCDHCRAVCENDAISVAGIDRRLSQFTHVKTSESWLPFGEYDTAGLLNLMQSRRSCRNFKPDPVPKTLLEDLVKIGITAPSGSNCQEWRFTILPDRSAVVAFGGMIRDFFNQLNQMAERRWLRTGLKWIGKPDLDWYYANYYQQIKEGLSEWDAEGRDRLFHHAPAAIVVSSGNEASCPAEDALLATQNMLLAAHSLGLGTCLIGFAIRAMNRDHSIRKRIGLAENEDPYAVIALGYPDESYSFIAGRKPVTIRYFNS